MNKFQSRTQNVLKNASISLLCQVATTLLQFVGRTVFIHTLGKEYLGIGGLFTNILTILSLTELGVGNAMVFSMYKPLAEHDNARLKSLMRLYKKAYTGIGIAVAIIGICLIPFLKFFIKDEPNISESLILIYILFLANSAVSYFFSYKKSIFIADQRLYVINMFLTLSLVVQLFLQIIVLVLTHNYILYLLVQVGCTVLNNIWTAKSADKNYPFILEDAEPLDAVERRRIVSDVKSLSMYQLGSTILNGTDNILISSIFGLEDVGLVSNYVLISSCFTTFLGKITNAFTASVGNLNTQSDIEKQYVVFKKLFFLCVWMFGFASYGMLLFYNDVIELWLGKDYLLPQIVVIAMVSAFYVSSVQFAAFTYRTTFGLFRQGRFAPIIAAVLNLFLSILLGKTIGLCGIFFATAISRFMAITVTDVCLIFIKKFKISPLYHFASYIVFIIMLYGLYILAGAVISLVPVSGILGLALKIIIASVIYHGFFLVAFYKNSIMRELLDTMKKQVFKSFIRWRKSK